MQTTKATAIKAFYYSAPFLNELEVYRYLKRWNITEVTGFHIPELVGSDEGLRIIEMSVVMPPFILDFVEAQIDQPIERDDDAVSGLAELFESDWDRVKFAIWKLEEHGIYLTDRSIRVTFAVDSRLPTHSHQRRQKSIFKLNPEIHGLRDSPPVSLPSATCDQPRE